MAQFSSTAGQAGSAGRFVVGAFSGRQFIGDERGTVAILFGLMGICLFAMGGLAVDVSRMLAARTALTETVDAAALAVGRALMDGRPQADAQKIGESFFNANVNTVWHTLGTKPKPTITTDPASQKITVNASVEVGMTLMGVLGFQKVTVPARSEVRYDMKDLEIGVAIDVTGSMNETIEGERKIDSLKRTFRSFSELILPDTPQPGRTVRMGVAPYSAAINLGTYAKPASNSASADNCVTERTSGKQDDSVPGPSTGYFSTKADGIKDIDPTQGLGNTYTCPSARILPLTADRAKLVAHVDGFSPGGTTGGHFGVQWGWNLVSEDYAGFWGGASAPASYSLAKGKDGKLIKAVILMTDGIFNVAYRHGKSRDQSLALCKAMKDRGVLVFAVGFGLTNDADSKVAQDTLRACASDGPEYFANAANATQLDTAFRQFATVLNKLRISK